MSTTVLDSIPVDSETHRIPAGLSQDDEGTRNSRLEWTTRAVIVVVAGGLAWYTWGHWGDFQIDCGRELYVPAALLQGKLLYRDIWYQYAPLAPYASAFLFWIFGVHLTVLYIFGLALTVGTALITFEVARQFNLGRVGSAVPSLFFLVEAFYPFIRNFIFPYSYAASLGAFLGLTCLYFVIRYASDMRPLHLGLAAVFAGLASLSKQEFGLACIVLLPFVLVIANWTRRSWPEILRNTALCLAALTPALAVYAWFISRLSLRGLLLENFTSTPGSYFMRSVGKQFMADQGLRFVPSELLEVAEYAAVAMAIWYVLASLNALVIAKLKLNSRLWMALPLVVSMIPMALACAAFAKRAHWGMIVNTLAFARSFWESDGTRLLFNSMTQVIFPTGIFLLVIFFIVSAIWNFWRSPATAITLQEIALGIYGVLVGFRQMMELEPTLFKCAVFFNVPAFLIFVILLNRVIRWASRSLDLHRREFLVGAILAAEAGFLFVLFFPKPQILPAAVTTDYGTFYARYDVAALFPQIVSFMKTHTKNGKDILVIPEPPSLYLFAGMQAPTRWLQLTPGLVRPEEEQEYINQLNSNGVRYILIINRSFSEYGVAGFTQDGYNHEIYRWIMANYVPAGQFGPLTNKSDSLQGFVMWIYEKKDADANTSVRRIGTGGPNDHH